MEKGEQTRQHLVKQKVVDGLRRQLLASTKDQVGYVFRLWKDQVRETALRELEAKLGDQEKELRNNAAQMDEQDGVIAGLEAEISGLKDQLDRAEAGLEQTKHEHAESMRAMVETNETMAGKVQKLDQQAQRYDALESSNELLQEEVQSMAAELDNLRTLLSLHEKTVHEHNEAREQMEQEHAQAVEALLA